MHSNLIFFFIFLALTSCTPHHIPPEEMDCDRHWLYTIIPAHRSQIAWYDAPHWVLWGLFGNDDDGLFGERRISPYCIEEENTFRKALRMSIRNPLHNFTFYVIGQANRINDELTLIGAQPKKIQLFCYSDEAKNNFLEGGSSFFLCFTV